MTDRSILTMNKYAYKYFSAMTKNLRMTKQNTRCRGGWVDSDTYRAAGAFPLALGHSFERRVETGEVVGVGAMITQYQVAPVLTLLAVVLLLSGEQSLVLVTVELRLR